MSLPPPVLAERYGQWTVIGTPYQAKSGARVRCRCTCDKERDVYVGNLVRGGSNGCGCQKRRTTTHGMTGTPLYIVWSSMKARCYRPKETVFKHYGGRGITVCPEWIEAFEPFRDWALAHGWREGLELDRIDNDGNYSPDNCRIVTKEVNMRNRRVTVFLTAWGETRPLMDWAEDDRCVVPPMLLFNRVERGWPHERAIGERRRNDPKRVDATCRNGHPITEATTRWTGGRRVCRLCASDRNARYNRRPTG